MGVNAVDIFPMGSARLLCGSSAGPASYATGGFDPGFPTGTLAFCSVDNGGGYVTLVDYVNKLLKVYFGDNNNASDGPLIEVGAGLNLSAVTFRFLAVVRP